MGPLESDGAADFALDLADLTVSRRWDEILDRLRAIPTTGYVEAPQAEEAEEAVSAAATART